MTTQANHFLNPKNFTPLSIWVGSELRQEFQVGKLVHNPTTGFHIMNHVQSAGGVQRSGRSLSERQKSSALTKAQNIRNSPHLFSVLKIKARQVLECSAVGGTVGSNWRRKAFGSITAYLHLLEPTRGSPCRSIQRSMCSQVKMF